MALQIMNTGIANGSRKEINGKPHIFYDGYWIRYYPPPDETLSAKRDLLLVLTRRTFHHTEPGINTPGNRVETARQAYESERAPERKRVNAAMLAGALFNRATDLFTSIVDLEERGIRIDTDNELMTQCSECFQEALELGKQVRHSSGHEGIDELWGEPLKVFTQSIAAYYESRYVKIAQAMAAIDNVADHMVSTFKAIPGFDKAEDGILDYARAARQESEIMKSDPDFFYSWPEFVTLAARIKQYEPSINSDKTNLEEVHGWGKRILSEGVDLISYMAGVRVPMPKSTRQYLDRLEQFSSATKKPHSEH